MRGRLRPLALLGAAVLVLALAACGGTAGVSGTGEVTSVDSSGVPVRTLSTNQVDAVLDASKAQFRAAAKAFHACDRKVSADGSAAYPCLKKLQAEAAIVDAMVDQLTEVQVPPASETAVKDLEQLAAAGRLVANKCAQASDQTCDQALARFRAHEQSLIWDLQLTI